MKKRNPNKITEEIKTIIIDEDGFELEEDGNEYALDQPGLNKRNLPTGTSKSNS